MICMHIRPRPCVPQGAYYNKNWSEATKFGIINKSNYTKRAYTVPVGPSRVVEDVHFFSVVASMYKGRFNMLG
jgi:hypothetical protein